jgi:hypothetical protein
MDTSTFKMGLGGTLRKELVLKYLLKSKGWVLQLVKWV